MDSTSLAPSWTVAALDTPEAAAPRAASRNPAAVYLARLAPGSRRTMAQALESIAALVSGGRADARSLEWGALRYQHTAAIRARLAERHAPATANKMLAALRGVLREAERLGQVAPDDARRACDLPVVKGSTLPRGRALSAAELRALFAACGAGPAGARDRAVLAILYGAGLRRAEAAALELADYAAGDGALTVRAGKGNKDRLAYLAAGGPAALDAWLVLRGADPGALLCPVDKAGRVTARPLTPQSLLLILGRLAAAAGVAAFSPHDLRRTFISDLLDAGADIAAVQRLAGHANVQTTARYDRRGEGAKRRAAGLLSIPAAER